MNVNNAINPNNMRLTTQMARAYGVNKPAFTNPAASPSPTPNTTATNATSATNLVERATAIRADSVSITSTDAAARIQPAAPTEAMRTQAIEGMSRLVAGQLNEAMNFDKATPAMPTANAGEVLPMYNRAADRIEAATAIQLGQRIDVSG